jgi:hypothetical protein
MLDPSHPVRALSLCTSRRTRAHESTWRVSASFPSKTCTPSFSMGGCNFFALDDNSKDLAPCKSRLRILFHIRAYKTLFERHGSFNGVLYLSCFCSISCLFVREFALVSLTTSMTSSPGNPYLSESRQPQLYSAFTSTYALAIISVCLRIFSRKHFTKAGIWLDDYAIFAALAFASANFVNMIICKSVIMLAI